jgi:hypothetical protein
LSGRDDHHHLRKASLIGAVHEGFSPAERMSPLRYLREKRGEVAFEVLVTGGAILWNITKNGVRLFSLVASRHPVVCL